MTERRRKLRARFRASALEQLAQLSSAADALRRGTAPPDAVRELSRALHTLKGDASFVGMPEITSALHTAEDRTLEGAWDALADALDAVTRELERGDDGPAMGTLPPGGTVPPPLSGPDSAGGAGGSPAAGAPGPAPHTAVYSPPSPRAGHTTGPPPMSASPGQPVAASSESAPSQRWVRLQASAIDELSDRLLELSTAYGRLTTGLSRAVRDVASPDAVRTVALSALRALAEDGDSARRQLDDVVGAAWALRLVSVEELLRRMAEHALELARAQGKPLRIRCDGAAELERSTLDALEQPLLHLVRNAVDHGVEDSGGRGAKAADATLVLEARATGGSVEISVEDDGRGIDPAAVRTAAVERGLLRADEAAALSDTAAFELVFQFGLSTRRQASELSGRGVGLDAVRGRVEGLGGSVRLASRAGHGARFVLSVPAAIARERAVVVEAAGGMFALPSRSVAALIRLGDHARRGVAGGIAVELDAVWAPLRGLADVLGLGAGTPARDDTPALVLEANGRRHVFAVDRIDGEHDLLRRPADTLIGQRELVTASSILDDGRVALWPSVPALLRGGRTRSRLGTPAPQVRRTPRILVVDDSPVVCELVASILRTAAFTAETAPDGEAAWRALEREPADLVLSDVEMPRLDGFGLLRRIRDRWPHLPVVMLTTRGSEEDRRRAVALGADAYLIKAEFEEGRLLDTVRRLIGPLS